MIKSTEKMTGLGSNLNFFLFPVPATTFLTIWTYY